MSDQLRGNSEIMRARCAEKRFYYYIEPNKPNKYEYFLYTKVLASNSFVDNYKYDQYWVKTYSRKDPKYRGVEMIGSQLPTPPPPEYYSIGDKSRQALANVLIAVH
jgi:hypothetical protein